MNAGQPPPRVEQSSKSQRFHSFEQFKELRVSEVLASGEPAALVTLAVQELGYVRSTLGYMVGEQVLDLCAERLISETRDCDLVVALRGDSFGVVLRGMADEDSVRGIAERLAERLERSFLVEGQLIDLQVSVGIATSPEGAEGVDGLLSRSSLALRAGRGTGARALRFFEQGMEETLVLERALTQDIRKALPLRQFSVHYQPQVDTIHGRVTGVEALLRWQHPVRGAISPALFIPLAESSGMIHQLGAWVLRTACKQAAALPETVRVAVNVSPIQLRNPDFSKVVCEALSAAKLPGWRLELEITEGILLDSTETVSRTIQTLRELGILLAIDDFGTGYSSLSQIGRLPFTMVKIDKSLVGLDTKRRAVVRAIVALASGLGMEVLAEGVETEEEVAALQADGCYVYQGYYFGRPTPAPELIQKLEAIHVPKVFARIEGKVMLGRWTPRAGYGGLAHLA